MDYDEEAALVAIILLFTENTNRKKRRKRMEEGMDQTLVSTETIHSRDILLPNILLLFLFFSILFDFVVFPPLNLNCLSTSIFTEIYHTCCSENLRHVNF